MTSSPAGCRNRFEHEGALGAAPFSDRINVAAASWRREIKPPLF